MRKGLSVLKNIRKEEVFEVCLEIFLFCFIGKCFFLPSTVAIPDLLGFIALSALTMTFKWVRIKDITDTRKLAKLEHSLNALSVRMLAGESLIKKVSTKAELLHLARKR